MTTKLSFGCKLFEPTFAEPPDYTPNLDGYLEPDDPEPPTGPGELDPGVVIEPPGENGFPRIGTGGTTLGGGGSITPQCLLWNCPGGGVTVCNSSIRPCSDIGSGYYLNQTTCNANCTTQTQYWTCKTPGFPTGTCILSPIPTAYTSQNACQTACITQPTIYWLCVNGVCVQNSIQGDAPVGSYSTLTACQQSCSNTVNVTGFQCRNSNQSDTTDTAGNCPGTILSNSDIGNNVPVPVNYIPPQINQPNGDPSYPTILSYYQFIAAVSGSPQGGKFGTLNTLPGVSTTCRKTRGCFSTTLSVPANQSDWDSLNSIYGLYQTQQDCEKAQPGVYGCRDSNVVDGVGRHIFTDLTTTPNQTIPNANYVICYECQNISTIPSLSDQLLNPTNSNNLAVSANFYPCPPYTNAMDQGCKCKYTYKAYCNAKVIAATAVNTQCTGTTQFIYSDPTNFGTLLSRSTDKNTACPPNACKIAYIEECPALNSNFGNNFIFGLPTSPQSVPPNIDYSLSLFKRQPTSAYLFRSFNEKYRNIFGQTVHSSIAYYLNKGNVNVDWKSEVIYDLTIENIYASLTSEFKKLISNIYGPDGNLIPIRKFLNLVRNKLIENRLEDINIEYLIKLKNQPRIKKYYPIKTSDNGKNISNALSFIERTMIPLEASNASNVFVKNKIPLIKALATDVEKALPIMVSGVETKYYLSDDDTVIARSGLKVEDGDYVILTASGIDKRLYLTSERDHAFIINNFEKNIALNLLDGDPKVYLTASSQFSANVEFSYDLSTLRENVYILKLNTDNINTQYLSTYLDETTAEYTLMGVSTTAELRTLSNYIKYKSNYKAFGVSYDDLILDHMLESSSITLRQQDIRSDGHARKNNKDFPLLVRQLPWYILLIPTNKQENSTFLSKSKIKIFDRSKVSRTLSFSLPVNRDKFNPDAVFQNENFVNTQVDQTGIDIFQNENLDALTLSLNLNNNLFTETYKENSKQARTAKTSLRVAYEIITELNSNYVLDKGITTFDFFSRMNLQQYAEFKSLFSNSTYLQISNGAFGPKIYTPMSRSGRGSLEKTSLIKRRASAPSTDNYVQIKSTNDNTFVQPPTREDAPRIVPTLEPL